jgi:hypothetical protein
MTRRFALLLSGLALTACDGLDNPDLATGSVTGRILNASSAAYVYPLGRPDLRVSNSSGSGTWQFTIERVPVETEELVVVDTAGVARAQLVRAEVEGGEVRQVRDDVDAAAMRPAGRVAAAARLQGGCGAIAVSPRFTVGGTDQAGVPANSTGGAELELLPEGRFDLLAEMVGFRKGRTTVDVVAGATTPKTVVLEIDDESEARGCNSGGGCHGGDLHCSPTDGACYECLADGDCGNGRTCDTAQHVCRAAGTNGDICESCTGDFQCAGGLCFVPSGASAGYCSRSCAGGAACPAGFDCQGGACVAPTGCARYIAAFHSDCFDDDACRTDLKNGACQEEYPDGYDNYPEPDAGECSAPCSVDADCPRELTCQLVAGGRYCK